MKLELKVYSALCAPKIFRINGIEADEDDFGFESDYGGLDEDDYGCANRVFEAIEPRQKVLNKYKITIEEYKKIAKELEDKLSFGSCGLCN